MKRRYDLVFSMGAACACTECLRKAGLQFGSFPFDWVSGSTLVKRTDILVDDGDNWLKLENLEHVFSASVIRTEAYRNNATGITFNHDFPAGVPIEESIARVREKYDRRFERLRSLLVRGGRVLAVYATTPPNGLAPTAEEAAYCRHRLGERFPAAEVDVLVLRPGDGAEVREEFSGDGVRIVSFDYRSRTDTTGVNPVDRDAVVRFLKSERYAARDYRTAEERRAWRGLQRKRKYDRYGATNALDCAFTKLQYKLFSHLRKRLQRKGIV